MRKTQKRTTSKRKGGNSKSRKAHTKKSRSSAPISDMQAAMHLDKLETAISLQEENIRSNKPLFMTDVNYYAKTLGEKNLPTGHKRRVSVLRTMKTLNKTKK